VAFVARKMGKLKRRAKKFWRNVSQEAAYEYLVDGPKALPEIKQFHDDEESVLLDLLQQYVDKKENIAFIEIGCGPGRIVRRIASKIIEQPETWGCYIKYVVGVDFEVKMIERAIESLIKRERIIRDWVSLGTAHELARRTDRSPMSVKETFRERIVFLDADAELPFLRCRSIIPIVGVMFGTLGNIQRPNSVLKNISKLCGLNGKALVVVFNKENYPVGIERYEDLSKRDFEPLIGTIWNEDKGYFFSEKGGFYSRWYSADELADMLKKHFAKGFQVQKVGKNGFYAILSPRPRISRIMIRDAFQMKKEEPNIRLLCPECGTELRGGTLPLKDTSDLTCPRKHCTFHVRDIMGFMIPLLETENNCPNHKDAKEAKR
jgi:SAM-dependent methyltransferase